jgi:hypothetical protein
LGVSPVKALVNAPVPVPSVVLLSAVVGLADVLQQTPRAVTAAPPSELMFPPLEAVVDVMAVTAVVVSVGAAVVVVKPTSDP